mmetsp:Transcript_13254/g.32363  ORF Transcript_13254/g.32363 Transcript_13254/m.32363 type:complete len:217 (+) Transcript_13254:1078-1728(+)
MMVSSSEDVACCCDAEFACLFAAAVFWNHAGFSRELGEVETATVFGATAAPAASASCRCHLRDAVREAAARSSVSVGSAPVPPSMHTSGIDDAVITPSASKARIELDFCTAVFALSLPSAGGASSCCTFTSACFSSSTPSRSSFGEEFPTARQTASSASSSCSWVAVVPLVIYSEHAVCRSPLCEDRTVSKSSRGTFLLPLLPHITSTNIPSPGDP